MNINELQSLRVAANKSRDTASVQAAGLLARVDAWDEIIEDLSDQIDEQSTEMRAT